MRYQHTQTAFGAPVAVISVAVVATALTLAAGTSAASFIALAVALLLCALALTFSRLTVLVDGDSVQAAFGWGWPRRGVALADIAAVRTVRTTWWQGIGIRKIRRGWMFNIRLGAAVALELRSGKIFQIGTDDADQLRTAIEAAVYAAR